MKKIITIILIIILALISYSCAVKSDVVSQKHEYFYMSNENFIKYKYCYHVDL